MTKKSDVVDEVIDAVRANGFYAARRDASELYPLSVLCSQSKPGPGRGGVSFWVTFIGEGWCLASWGYRYWRVPSSKEIVPLCIAYLSRGSSIGSPPSDVVDEFELDELSRHEFSDIAKGDAGDDDNCESEMR